MSPSRSWVLGCILAFFAPQTSESQSGSLLGVLSKRGVKDGEVIPLGSPSNPFAVGAQLTVVAGDKASEGSGLSGAGLLKLTLYEERTRGIYLFSNVSGLDATVLADPAGLRKKISEIVSSQSGLDLRVYGEQVFADGRLALWLSVAGRANAAKATDSSEATTIGQLRSSFGAEVRMPHPRAGTDTVPQKASLSVETFGGRLLRKADADLLGRSSQSFASIEFSAIFPVAWIGAFARRSPTENSALLVQYVSPISTGIPSFWRVGVMVAAGAK